MFMKYFLTCTWLMALCLPIKVIAEDCNPKTDIYELPDAGKFVYKESCHLEFGRLRLEQKQKEQQVEHLEKSLKLKDIALDLSNKRIDMWQQATYKMEDKVLKMENNNDNMRILYFGVGVLVMGAATWAAGQLR